MEINPKIVMKNLGTFTHAYGLEPNSNRLVEDIISGSCYVVSVGILLRDPITKDGLISCQFPVNDDITNQMLWIPVDDKPLEAVPIYTREAWSGNPVKNFWKRIKDNRGDDPFYQIEEGRFRLRVHHRFSKQGVIEKYIAREGYGFIRRNRRGIYFKKEWCNLKQIEEGQEVAFIPVISRKGLKARAIEEVRS